MNKLHLFIVFLLTFVFFSGSVYGRMDNRLILPKDGRPMVDIGYKNITSPLQRKIQKEIVEINAKLREVEEAFKLVERDVERKDCFVDDDGLDVCPENMVRCSGRDVFSRGYSIPHEESSERAASASGKNLETFSYHRDAPCLRDRYHFKYTTYTCVRRIEFSTPNNKKCYPGPNGLKFKLYTEDMNFDIVIKDASTGNTIVTYRYRDGGGRGFDSDGVTNYYYLTINPNGDFASATLTKDGRRVSMSVIKGPAYNSKKKFKDGVVYSGYIYENGSLYSRPMGYKISCYTEKGNVCPRGWEYNASSNKCRLSYTWYEYVCPNEEGWNKFISAGILPPFSKEEMTDRNGNKWFGPLVNSGGDCGGSCGSIGCSCNSETPPERNCKRKEYVCPIDPNKTCAKVPTGRDSGIDDVYAYGYKFSPGYAEHFSRTLKTQKICKGQDEPNFEPYPYVTIEGVEDYGFSYATRPHVSKHRENWTEFMRMRGISLSRSAFLLNDGHWYVYPNPPQGHNRHACGFSWSLFGKLPDGMLEVLEWYPKEKCHLVSAPVERECVKKAILRPKGGKYIVAISDIETVVRSVFGRNGCVTDNSFDEKFFIYNPEDGKEKGVFVSRQGTSKDVEPAIDIRYLTARNVGIYGAKFNPERNVCEMPTPAICREDGATFNPDIGKCIVEAPCNGYRNPETGKCEMIPQVGCREGYVYNEASQRCEADVQCGNGEFNPDPEFRRCIGSDFSCTNGFTPDRESYACVKSPIEYRRGSCPEPFLQSSGTLCSGNVDFTQWTVIDPLKTGKWIIQRNAVVQINDGYPTFLISSGRYKGFELTGYMRVWQDRPDYMNKVRERENVSWHFMGFVFGMNDTGDFYIVDWNSKNKGTNKGPSHGAVYGFRLAKASLKGDTLKNDWWASSSSSNIQVIRRNSAGGWASNRWYRFTLYYGPSMRDPSKYEFEFKLDGRIIFREQLPKPAKDGGKVGVYSAFLDGASFSDLKFTSANLVCPAGYYQTAIVPVGSRADKFCAKEYQGAKFDFTNNRYVAAPYCGENGYFDRDLEKCVSSPRCP